MWADLRALGEPTVDGIAAEGIWLGWRSAMLTVRQAWRHAIQPVPAGRGGAPLA